MIPFYALSFLSGFFETGPLMMTLVSGFTGGIVSSAIVQALACVLCYQIGNLAPCPVQLSRPIIIASGLLGTFCFTVAMLSLPHAAVLAARLLGSAFISVCIQSARSVMKSGASKMFKRGARVAGFALGFFCTPLLAPVAAVLAVIFSIAALRRIPAIKSRVILPRLDGLNAVMIFHQMHYFVYCYAAFIIAFELGGRASAVLAFLASWTVYVLSPLLYRKVKDPRKAFFFGHSLLVIILTGIYFVPPLPVKLLLYLMTGIGGTTEFCIGNLAKKWGLYREDVQGFSENIGHVLGVAACLLLFIIQGDLQISLLFAAAFALTAIACMAKKVISISKE
ncbi:hypothetical protein [Leadbettera azotonutricia]|uniref:Putative membrane protein n=1 Tax=Leadbettera azotonutricia (strain ATCC BAA-888 / DSM 13862 / ZAS-9) TaxID=545695 RepID=F5YD15_LEAAZ|nr:hypothetical protein [Leadbettera azotonutricia]AEF83167.1 putative membrane protein [Leadbettera azotonutricia ZAS-9]